MNFNETNWLSHYFDGQINYSFSEIESIRNFVLIWNIFEAAVGNRSMDTGTIDRLVDKLANYNLLIQSEFQEFIDYARQSYNQSGSDIRSLNIRNQDLERRVLHFLENRQNNLSEMVKALLYITYRMRNNLMHGEKNVLTIDTQNADFNLVNKLLAKILDLHKECENLRFRIT